jgi:hypothetical protein
MGFKKKKHIIIYRKNQKVKGRVRKVLKKVYVFSFTQTNKLFTAQRREILSLEQHLSSDQCKCLAFQDHIFLLLY